MDYLSYLALKEGQAVPDCVVLNSVANLPKAVDILKSYGQVCCFLDNDETGRKAVEEIGRLCEKVTEKEAAETLREVDEKRSAFQEQCTSTKWGDGNEYDLCINTGIIGIEYAVEMILEYIRFENIL